MMKILKYLYGQQFAKLIYRRGIAYEQRQCYQKAVDAFSQAITTGYCPVASAVVRRGVNRKKLGDSEGAIADFISVIQSKQIEKPSSNLSLAEAYYYRGQLHQQSEDEVAAISDWAAAISCCPTYSLPYFYRALVYLRNENYGLALRDLNAAIQAYPTLPLAYFERGKLHLQLHNKADAISDLTHAVCNDFTLEAAKETLKRLQKDTDDAQLTQILEKPLQKKGLSVKVHHRGDRLNIQIHRAVGIGVNYHTLPTTIRKHLVPLLLDEVSHFQLIGSVGDASQPDWNQSYRLYKDQPCPPSHWQAAAAATIMFPPLAIPALILSAKVRSTYKKGKYVEALSASRSAKVLSLASSLPFSLFLWLSYMSYDFENKRPVFGVANQSKPAELIERKLGKR